MKSTTLIILLLLIFTFSISSGVSRACCWNMDNSAHQSNQVQSDSENEPCHTKSEDYKTHSEDKSQESNDCCYDMIECKIQVIKISNAVPINPSSFTLLWSSSINNFNSNTIEPLKHPPKVLL